MIFLVATLFFFVAFMVGVPIFFAVLRFIGLYATVNERESRVYVLFGNVIGTITEPGLHFLWFEFGPAALIVNIFGKCHRVDMAMVQEYLRSQPVNSEEGAPMGIGVWYEMQIQDPQAYLFRNMDPKGSLRANVASATVRCLSNLKLGEMLESRHAMSRAVRTDVAPNAAQWGYNLGSVYVRKVHFRDPGMIHQIEEKVTNRLRQVTYAIRQDGSNQVNVITSTAERQAAIEFAKASAVRPQIVGSAIAEISRDPEVTEALFTVLETQRMTEGDSRLVILPAGPTDIVSALSATSALPPPALKRA